MNTKELENCLHIIGYWLNKDETVIDKILNSETHIVKHFFEPFRKELNSNLLNKDTIEAKRDVIKFYVFEFWELQGFYKEYEEILFTGSICNYTPVFYEHINENRTVRKLSKFENYVVNSWILFDMMFNEIQLCCIKYKIDFFNVCTELNFSTKYFDSSATLAFEEMHRKNLPPQQSGLTINQIALKYVYEGLQITRENSKKIAKQYGHNSGEKLFQRFTYYTSSANRKGKPTPCTPKKLDNKIKLIERVIEILPIDKQERAKDEVSILKKIYEAEYQ